MVPWAFEDVDALQVMQNQHSWLTQFLHLA